MKIFYSITKSETGGAQTHVFQLCKGLMQKGHIAIVMAHPGGWLEQVCQEFGISFIPNTYFSNSLNPFSYIKAGFLLRKAVYSFGPDLISCHSSIAALLVRLFAPWKVPIVYTVHGWGFQLKTLSWWKRFGAFIIEKVFAFRTAGYVYVSNYCFLAAEKFRIGNKKFSTVIPNGIEINKEIAGSKNLAFFEQNPMHIVCVARFAPPKRVDVLLQALEFLTKEEQSQCALSLIGDGPERGNLEILARKLSLNELVFYGSVDREHVADVLKNAQLFISLSSYEGGRPYVLLEAMSQCTPVMVNSVGAVSELIYDNIGVLLPSLDPGVLAKELRTLLRSREVLYHMAHMGYDEVQKNYSVERVVDQTESFFEYIIT